jgi:flagellar biosynthesis protein FlhF
MIIKRYLVNNMNEAMTRIRYELGKDAVIISQRKIKKPGFKGFFSKKIIEVTAAVDNTIKSREEAVAEEKSVVISNEIKNSNNEAKNESKVVYKNEGKDESKVVYKNEGKDESKVVYKEDEIKSKEDNTINKEENVSDLVKEMKEMKNLMSSMLAKPTTTKRKSSMQVKLESSDLNERVIKKILTKLKAMEENLDEAEKLKLSIEKMVSITDVKLEGTIALVGPTGVGKTTTIAKLAGKLSLIDKKSVGLITIDTYRIGAVDQLRAYADIMNIPFKAVLTCKELEGALLSMSKCDVVLVDTTGRSSKNSMQISELRTFVDKLNTKNIHLVISSTTKNRDIETIIDGYKVLNYRNVIITKLDETSSYGSILNIIDYAKKPLSFVTTGQSVPDDIKVLTPSEVSSMILKGDIL